MKLCIIDQIRDNAIDSTQFEPDPRLQGFDKKNCASRISSEVIVPSDYKRID